MDRFKFISADGVEADSLQVMENQISGLMDDGWSLHGDTQFVSARGQIVVVQVLVVERARYSIGNDGHLRKVG